MHSNPQSVCSYVFLLGFLLLFVNAQQRDSSQGENLPRNCALMWTRDQQERINHNHQSNSTFNESSINNSSAMEKRQSSTSFPAQLFFKGGPVMTKVFTKAIFWGTNWMYRSFHQDKLDAMDLFFNGLSDSDYMKTVREYTGSNGRSSSNITYQGRWVDTSSASIVSALGSIQYEAVVNKICSIMTNQWNRLDPEGMSFIPVFVDIARPKEAAYCAWHSYSTCPGSNVRFQFAFHWNLDNDGACDPRDSNNLHSQGFTAITNVLVHEMIGAVTDPLLNTWLDSQGREGVDKCAWKYPAPYATLKNGARFKFQANWSNRAYFAGTGSPDLNGNRGCIMS